MIRCFGVLIFDALPEVCLPDRGVDGVSACASACAANLGDCRSGFAGVNASLSAVAAASAFVPALRGARP